MHNNFYLKANIDDLWVDLISNSEMLYDLLHTLLFLPKKLKFFKNLTSENLNRNAEGNEWIEIIH